MLMAAGVWGLWLQTPGSPRRTAQTAFLVLGPAPFPRAGDKLEFLSQVGTPALQNGSFKARWPAGPRLRPVCSFEFVLVCLCVC